jgi:nucleotide-binding universal stress UspA family protein
MVDGFKRIMLPVDFSVDCDRAADYAAWFARVSRGTIYLVHVIANPADPLYEPQEAPYWQMVEHSERKARALIEAAAQRCLPARCPRECHILHGDPYEKLLDVAEILQPDLIVMSTRGRGAVAQLVIGSVAEKTVRHAPCPVFVVHRDERAKAGTTARTPALPRTHRKRRPRS